METNLLSDEEINNFIAHACKSNRVEIIRIFISWKWSNALKTTAGVAYYRRGHIEFSRNVFSKATREEQINTVIHEACHIIARALDAQCKPHGALWKQCMINAGQEPTRCHNVDVGPRKRRSDSVEFVCACADRTYTLGAKRAARATLLQSFQCRKCKTIIRPKNT